MNSWEIEKTVNKVTNNIKGSKDLKVHKDIGCMSVFTEGMSHEMSIDEHLESDLVKWHVHCPVIEKKWTVNNCKYLHIFIY